MRTHDARRVFLVWMGAQAFLGSMAWAAIPLWRIQQAGLGALQLVLIGTVLELSCFSFEVPTGIVADLYGRRRSILIGVGLGASVPLVEGLWPAFVPIVLAQVASGFAYTFTSGATEAWISGEVGDDAVGEVFMRASQTRRAAAIAGMATGALLATAALRLPILLSAAGQLVLFVWLLASMRETAFVNGHGRTHWRDIARTARDGAQAVRGSPVLKAATAVSLCIAASSEGVDRLWELHFLTAAALPAAGSPVLWLNAVHIASSVIAIVVVGRVRVRTRGADPATLARLVAVCCAVQAVAIVGFGLAASFAVAATVFVVARVASSIEGPTFASWVTPAAEQRVRATALSFLGQANAIGQVVAGPPVGALGSAVSARAALVVSGVLLSPGAVIAAIAGRVRRPTNVEST